MSEGRQWIGDGLSGISTNGGGIGVAERVEDRMLTLLKRHEVQTLLAAGHDQIEVAVIAGVSVRSVTWPTPAATGNGSSIAQRPMAGRAGSSSASWSPRRSRIVNRPASSARSGRPASRS